jgi:hypothetical protein
LTIASALVVVPLTQAQTNASCTFSYFVPPAPYNASFFANGINKFNTVVGTASNTSGILPPWKAFIRYSGGGITWFAVPNAASTVLNKRNATGLSVGYYQYPATNSPAPQLGLMLTSSGYSTLKYPGSFFTVLTGVNKYNVIVGYYGNSYSDFPKGFKYANGKFTLIKFPGAAATMPSAINDNGVVVGSYVIGNFENPPHGFILQNGTYKSGPLATDINNLGVMVAGNQIIYPNGTYKIVNAPGSYQGQTNVYGINDAGIVTGTADFAGPNNTFYWKAFTAPCK